MLVVGEPGAGKTSLVRKLENPKAQLPEDSETTKGIDVLRYDFEIHQTDFPNFTGKADIEGNEFRVNLWDFGGQEIYLATHRFFLSKRALYAVVSDSRKEDTDFNYWLHIVEMFADNSPVLIILNQKDGREHQLDSGALRARFNSIRDIKTVNLADDDHTRLKQIQQIIRHEISQLDHIGSPLPNTWLQVREQLENTPKNVIKPHEYLAICLSCGIDDEQDAMTLSQYFHDIGVFLHFHDDAVLKNIIFLKPNWATNAIYQVLDDAVIFDNKGLLSKNDIRNIWQDGELEKYCDEFLKLMEKFHLALKIQASENYIVPAKLPTEAPSNSWSAYNNLNFRYQYDEFMPKGILFHLMVELQHLIVNHANVWRRGMLVEKNGAIAEISETYLSKAIHIRINAINNSDGNSLRDLLIIIMDKLDVINSQYNHLKVEKLVPCHCSECKGIEEPFFYKYSSLQKRKQKNILRVQCDNSYEMLNVNALLNAVMDEPVNQANKCEYEFKTKKRAVVRDQIFISYSHQDKAIFERVKTHFKAANNLGFGLKVWEDKQINTGDDWFEEIKQNLKKTQIAVLLVSTDFFASDFINREELPDIIAAMEQDGAKVFSLIVEPCLYNEHPVLSRIQCVNSPDTELSSLSNNEKERQLVALMRDIKREIEAV